MHVEPQSPRFTVECTTEGLRAVVPARRNWFVLLFLCTWLVGWVFGEVAVTCQLLSPSEGTPQLFLLAWLVGWTLGGAFALTAVLWQLAGKEVISVNAATMLLRVEAFGLGWSRAYKASEVKNLRATEYASNPFTNQAAWLPPLIGSGFGPVAFDYGARTFRLGAAFDEAEAKLLVERLVTRLPGRLGEV
jgi:hypothetical protein